MRLLDIFKDILDMEKPGSVPSKDSAAAKDRKYDPTVRAGFEDLKSLLISKPNSTGPT